MTGTREPGNSYVTILNRNKNLLSIGERHRVRVSTVNLLRTYLFVHDCDYNDFVSVSVN